MKTNNGEGIDAKSGRCRVCGDAAVYMYFGTLACQACKMFFKRYGNNQRRVSACSADGQCEINLNTRHLCTACRLQKCLASGMQVEKIRHSTCVKSTKRKSKKMAPYVALDHRLYLTSAQHCLLNNLTHIHDFSNIQTTVHRVNQIEYPKDSPLIRPIHPTVMREFLLCTYQTAAIIWRRNQDFQTLHHLDRSLLLSTALNNITCLLASHTFAQYNLCRNPFLINHLVHLYGSSLLKCHHWTTSFAQLDDPIVFKLFLALFALSSVGRVNRPTLRQEFGDVKSILNIEHRYAEVTWKYLLNKYGHGEAVRRAMKMMRWLLAISVLVYESHEVERHMNEIEGVVEEVEIRLIMEETDKIIDGNM